MNMFFEDNIPIDKSRILLELNKFNNETVLKNNFPFVFRDLIETYYNKGLVVFISPHCSSVMAVVNRNDTCVFFPLLNTQFYKKLNKTYIIESLFLLGIGFLNYNRVMLFTNEFFKSPKDKKIAEAFFISNNKKNFRFKKCKFQFLHKIELDFLLHSKFILLETGFLFFKNNPFISNWQTKCIEFINLRKVSVQKKYNFASQLFKKVLNLKSNNQIRKKNKENKVEGYKNWKPDLYENCINQKVYLNLKVILSERINSMKTRFTFGSNMFYCNFDINITGVERVKKYSQKHQIPVGVLEIKSIEKKLCKMEKKKSSLEARLVNFQNYLLNKMEFLEKRFEGLYIKNFFQFNLILPHLFVCLDSEFSEFKTNISLQKLANKLTNRNFSSIFFMLTKVLLTFYLDRTIDSLIINVVYLMARISTGLFAKMNLFFFLTEFFQKKKNFSKYKEFFGSILENFLCHFTKNQKINYLRKFYPYSQYSFEINSIKQLKLKLVYFYIEFNLYTNPYNLLVTNLFYNLFFRFLFLHSNIKSLNLAIRKHFSRTNYIKRISLFIFLANLNKNLKYYEISSRYHSKLTNLMKYSLGIAFGEEIRFNYAKKQLFVYISKIPNNIRCWFLLGIFSLQNGDLLLGSESFNRVLNKQPGSKCTTSNLALCFTNPINYKRYSVNTLKKLIKAKGIPYFLILNFFYFSINRKTHDCSVFLNSFLYLFYSKTKNILRNHNFLRGSVTIFIDLLKKKKKNCYCKKIKQFIVNLSLELDVTYFYHTKFFLQLNYDSSLYQKIITCSMSSLFLINKTYILLTGLKKNLMIFEIEATSNFLKYF